MSARDTHSVAGGWLGTYWYRGRDADRPPCRFEATFSAPGSDGAFTGTIVDDGHLGEASAIGTQDGRRVRFTKIYLRQGASGELAPIEYEGTVAEDGRTMQGSWRITVRQPGRPRPVRVEGGWEAHRRWSEAEEPERGREEAAVEAVAALPAGSGPLVRR